MMPVPDRFRSMSRITSAENLVRRWVVPIFVGILCTNLAGPIAALAAGEPLVHVASITKSLTNQQITVEAIVTSVRPPATGGAPYYVILTEGGASVPLIFWPDMLAQLGSKIAEGNVIRASVKVSTYRGQIQLRINGVDDIDVVSGTAPPSAPANPQISASPATPTPTLIVRIKDDWANRFVVISGTISGSEKIDQGQQLSVQDGTGEIQVVLGEKALTGLNVAELQPGRPLTVTGAIKPYEGKTAIIPEVPNAIVLAPQ